MFALFLGVSGVRAFGGGAGHAVAEGLGEGGLVLLWGELEVEGGEVLGVELVEEVVKDVGGDGGGGVFSEPVGGGVLVEGVWGVGAGACVEDEGGAVGECGESGEGVGEEVEGCVWAVVGGEVARGELGGGGGGGSGSAEAGAEGGFEGVWGDGAVAEETGVGGVAEVEDGGLDADGGGPAVEDDVYFMAEGGEDVLGASWGEVAEGVGAGCGEGECAEGEEAAGDGVRGAADGHAVQPCGDDGGDGGALWEDEGEGAWPVEGGEALGGGAKVGEGARGLKVRNVDDEWV